VGASRLRVNCSTCFGRHTAHHQELRKCNCSLWFYIRFWLPAAAMAQPKTYVKPEDAITISEFLMMGGVSPETCWAIKKHWNNKLYYTVASCWLFLRDLCARIHGHQILDALLIIHYACYMDHLPPAPYRKTFHLKYVHVVTPQIQFFPSSRSIPYKTLQRSLVCELRRWWRK